MSVLKMIKWRSRSRATLDDVFEYVNAPSKTREGILRGTNGILTQMPVIEMQAVKQIFNKLGGRQWIHMVLSMTPDQIGRRSEAYMPVADRIARLFPGFQSFYAVHEDSPIRHIHLVLNSVSSLDGTKFSQSRSDLSRLKQRCNDILVYNHFDPIITSADSFWDTADHSNETTLDFLESDEVVITRQNLIDYNELTTFPGEHWCLPYDFGGENEMSNYVGNRREGAIVPTKEGCYAPVIPDTLTAAPGCVTILEKPNTPPEQTAALVRELMVPNNDAAVIAATIGNAIHQQNVSCGMRENLIITPTPAIIIDRRGERSAQDGQIVDIPYTEGNY